MTGHHAMFANIHAMLEAELIGHLPLGAFAESHRAGDCLLQRERLAIFNYQNVRFADSILLAMVTMKIIHKYAQQSSETEAEQCEV